MLKIVLLQQTQFTAFWLQLLRKSQHMQHRTKFWIKSADEDKPQVVPAWYNVMFGRPRTFSLIAWYFSFSLAWHHLNFRTAIVRGADIKWALHHCPTPTFFSGNFFRSPLESEWDNQNIFNIPDQSFGLKREQSTKTVKKIQRAYFCKIPHNLILRKRSKKNMCCVILPNKPISVSWSMGIHLLTNKLAKVRKMR